MLFMPLLLFFHLNIQHPLLPITHMTPLSPPTRPLSHSPKAYASDPNLNPFSPLSPDLAPNQLTSAQKPIMDSVIDVASADKPLITYTRKELLLIGRDCRGRGPPETMGALESWFGTIARPNQSDSNFEDPAIASISHSTGRRNNSSGGNGFGEGFGYGGGIGGGSRLHNNARGTRNIGLRRLPEGVDLPPHLAPPNVNEKGFSGQMGKFNVRSNSNMRLGGDEQKRERRNNNNHGNNSNNNIEDWRKEKQSRENGHQQRDRDNRDHDRPYQQRDRDSHQRDRRNNWHQASQHDEDEQPEWMNDTIAPADPAIANDNDALVKFTPGEDMIAAHKRAMKAKHANDWRGNIPPLPAFFASDPAIVSSVPAAASLEHKLKEINANNYLVETREPQEEPEPSQSAPQSAFSSRFHKFFGNGADQDSNVTGARQSAPVPAQQPLPPIQNQVVPENPLEQRKAALMGLLSTKSPTPKLEHNSPSQHFHQPSSPHVEIPSSMSTSNMYTSNTGFRPPHPNVLLQQLYAVGPSSNTNPSPVNHPHQEHAPTDPLQLLAQAQAQRGQYASPSQMPPQHMSLPPHFARPPPGMYDSLPPDVPVGFPPFMRPSPGPGYGPPPGAGPGYVPMPSYYQGPPRPSGMGVHGYPGPQPQQQMAQQPAQRYPPGQLNTSQQDMLSTLFAGLGPRSG
ncbi:hypothetical protein, variant [Cryptococcus neoformans var. grubii H99]|uniref:Uncharacterized protein n=1 Tax=Cryptococcus neoformans (strain H99 / ATCC 208821 / CBS 10515 / FGSC 9487) TaxID=235443 RepID=T2BQL3_CRYN9|nr:hypothetical protein, variant [Cryptococcus neoformans var. grubii H99]AGV15331.1 hypothetical protein, variant [Cryptococcus neoformans var. grubii H99]AUB22227.1 hypothetical protein CKF44_00634 [Cryptococcus neoformans var. grubii]|eukprot:XP_012046851.1 hypothetical protein, variant [Cryptococcus neoformans var. grubii H99]